MVATISHWGSVDSKAKAKHERSKLRRGLHVDVVPPLVPKLAMRRPPRAVGESRVVCTLIRELPRVEFFASQNKVYSLRREHRVVILPSWQGLGLGPALSDLSASLWTATAHGDEEKTDRPCWRYSSTTAHPRFGTYRVSNAEWTPTATNGKGGMFSHEYVGQTQTAVKRRLPESDSTNKRPFNDQFVTAATAQCALSPSSAAVGASAAGSSLKDAIVVD